MTLRVGINAQLLSLTNNYRNAGVAQYIYRILQHLAPSPGEEYVVYLPPGVSGRELPQRHGTTFHTEWFPCTTPALRVLWEQWLLPPLLLRRGIDVLHCPVNVVPMMGAAKMIVTIHDLSFVRYPNGFPAAKRRYHLWMTRLSARRSSVILADSESTRDDLVRYFGARADTIRVVYPGVTDLYRPQDPHVLAAFRQRHHLERPYILHVGTLQPRKNLARLIDAFALFKQQCPVLHQLVLVGGKGWMYDDLSRRVEAHGLQSDVLFVGYAGADELPLWYAGAQHCVFPSLYEGFGFPVVESMACGTPVITSNVSSLPEVAGSAGLLVDPLDTERISAAMLSLVADADLRAELVVRGYQQAARYTWSATALGVAGAYRVVGGEV